MKEEIKWTLIMGAATFFDLALWIATGSPFSAFLTGACGAFFLYWVCELVDEGQK